MTNSIRMRSEEILVYAAATRVINSIPMLFNL